MNKVLIVIPTYNEVQNITPLFGEIHKLNIKADILFIDDNSPDGTSKVIKSIAKKHKPVHLLARKGKLGIGSAHKDGINWAYRKGYSTLITMDCDFSHKPKDILKLLKQKNSAHIVVGSRYIRKGSISDWNPLRRLLASLGHYATEHLLSMPYDATGAFRLYNLKKIPSGVFDLVESNGYSFFYESLFILTKNKHSVKEVPIKLSARVYGNSKMSIKDAWRSLTFLIQTFYLSKIYEDSYVYFPQYIKAKKNQNKTADEWDEYWVSERKKRKILYDSVAVFYRKFIIRKTLNYFIKKEFKKNGTLLHAGCGGGQVDTDIVQYAKVTAFDISSGALNRYKNLYKENCEILLGDILKIPAKKNSFSGIYNLGVMEHFTQKDVKKILMEFHRVLKPNGKIVLFWPPQYGMSVIFLNTMHFILNSILGKNIRLHPEEITKVKSKKQISAFFSKTGFELEGFYFGPRDLFTYVVVVGRKKPEQKK